jgi:aryl carrier-like protein
MVPADFVFLRELPLTPSGKLDRRALPAPGATSAAGGEELVPPSTPTEAVLAAIWARVLGRERVGVRDSFFELGGDSILALQVVARARQAGLALQPRQLFQHPSIARLAASLSPVPHPPAEGEGAAAIALGPDTVVRLASAEPPEGTSGA